MIGERVGEIMTRAVRTGPGDVVAAAVLEQFAEHDIGSIVVTDRESGEMVGIVTETDVITQVAAGTDLTSVPLSEVMSSPVVTTEPSASIREVVESMQTHSIQRLPVVDGSELVGMVTTADVATSLPELASAHRDGPGEE